MKKQWMVFLILAILLSACSQGGAASLAGDWRLVSYGSASNLTPAVPNVDTSIHFGADGQLDGNVGCNSFSGGYKVKGRQIEFESLVSTLMACDELVSEQEGAAFAVFAGAATFELAGDTLTILAADGGSTLVLARK